MISFKKFLIEGGNAVKNVTRIKKECIKPTVDWLYLHFLKDLGLSKEDFALLGSAGKKPTSGDLDTAIFFPPLIKKFKLKTLDDVLKLIYEKAKKVFPDVNYMKGIGLVSVALPIQCEEQKGQYVQCDFMLTDDLNYTTWMYHGTGKDESRYKGLYRNQLLFAIAKNVDMKVLKKVENEPAEWERYILNLANGLKRVTQSRLGKKGQLLKSHKKVKEEFVTKNPDKIVKILLGNKFKAKDIMTFEDLWKAIHSKDFLYKKELNKIINDFKEFLTKDGFPLPEEVK